jgi:hypothetical protein
VVWDLELDSQIPRLTIDISVAPSQHHKHRDAGARRSSEHREWNLEFCDTAYGCT